MDPVFRLTPSEAKGEPARSIVSRLPYRIGRARDALLGKFRSILAEHGLTDSQWRVLRVLSSVEALDAGDTAQRAFLLPSSLSRILKDLNQRGLIVSWSPPDDARRSRHALSPVGRTLIADIEPHLVLVRQDIEQRFGTDRLRDLSALLDAFADALEP